MEFSKNSAQHFRISSSCAILDLRLPSMLLSRTSGSQLTTLGRILRPDPARRASGPAGGQRCLGPSASGRFWEVFLGPQKDHMDVRIL